MLGLMFCSYCLDFNTFFFFLSKGPQILILLWVPQIVKLVLAGSACPLFQGPGALYQVVRWGCFPWPFI